jgi:hypothetical protein
VSRADGAACIVDVSTNGSWLDGTKLIKGQTVSLQHRCELCFGAPPTRLDKKGATAARRFVYLGPRQGEGKRWLAAGGDTMGDTSADPPAAGPDPESAKAAAPDTAPATPGVGAQLLAAIGFGSAAGVGSAVGSAAASAPPARKAMGSEAGSAAASAPPTPHRAALEQRAASKPPLPSVTMPIAIPVTAPVAAPVAPPVAAPVVVPVAPRAAAAKRKKTKASGGATDGQSVFSMAPIAVHGGHFYI